MLAETAQELIVVFRTEVHDIRTYVPGDDATCLWSDVEILGYMTEASDALATKVGGIMTTLSIPYIIGAEYVPLPEYVLNIDSMKLVTADQKVDLVNENYGYRLATATGRPCEAYRDRNPRRLYLYPTPSEADTLQIICHSTIASALEADDDVPFTKAEDQRLLLEYMKWRAYSKQNAETEDLSRAKIAKDNYDNGSIERESSLRNQRRAPGVIKMEW